MWVVICKRGETAISWAINSSEKGKVIRTSMLSVIGEYLSNAAEVWDKGGIKVG
jgi:hypothetical protein